MSSINPGTINNAAKGDQEATRTLFNAIASQLQALSLGTGVQLLEPTSGAKSQSPNVAPPKQATLNVAGANGQYSISITNAPTTISAAPWHEVSFSTASNFSNPTTLPLTQGTSIVYAAPGANLFWRIRSSYDQQHFNSYRTSQGNAAVSASLQSSAATSNNVALNQSNYAYVDSIQDGTSAAVRIFGNATPGTAWVGVKGTAETKYPSATITNVPYLSNLFVAWDGTQYRLLPNLTGVFPDSWVLVGKVSVVGTGTPTLPTITATVVGGIITAFNITDQGNAISDPVTIVITDTTGSGAVAGAQTLSGGKLTAVAVANGGSGYSMTPVVTASGGVFGGSTGGGTVSGSNGGRLTNV